MITMYFGKPGSGKTTLACKIINKELKRQKKGKNCYKYVFANFPQSLCPYVDLTDLGKWTFPNNSLLVIDEAGIEYNNRKFKSLPQHTIEWFKLHRHYKVDIVVISQSWEDTDITLRRLIDNLWYIRRLGVFTACRRIEKDLDIDEHTKQIIDGYKKAKKLPSFLPFPFHRSTLKIFLRSPYYKYFDSYHVPDLPIKYDE